ncbi:MAG: regulatory protein RecX [Arenicellales bacterium WSBS_2016_MAG_OTU3]
MNDDSEPVAGAGSEKQVERKTRSNARIRAMDMLARREHSAHEIRGKLARQGHDEAEIESVLSNLRNKNLQSDARFGEMLVRVRGRRGKGPLKVRYELSQHQLDPDYVDELINATDWFEVAREAHTKKFGDRQPADYKERAKRMRFMQSRGFDSGTISAILNNKDFDT